MLVTGGAGFIGSNLVRYLVSKKNVVTVFDNFSSGYKKNLEQFASVKIVEGDVRNKTAVDYAVEDNEVIFHLAASVGNKRSIDNPVTDAEINVLGTLNVLEAARLYGVRKVITSSSAGIFGELITLPIKEDHRVEPDTPYGCTKLCEEKLCLAYSKLYPIEVVCLRYFNVYGPNQRYDAYGNVIPIFVFRMLRNEPLIIYGDGEQTRDFVHVNDVVQANVKAADANGVNGAYNIAGGKSITINNLVKLVTKNFMDSSKIEHSNPRPGDVKHSLADISLAHRAFDYTPVVEIERGIEEYVEWAGMELQSNM